MPVKIEFVGKTFDDVADQLVAFCEKFNLLPRKVPTIEVTDTEVLMTAHLDDRPPDLPNKPKRTRRQQAALEKLEGDAPSIEFKPTEEPAPAAAPVDHLKLKERCVDRLSEIYLDEGGAKRVADLVRKHGGGVKKVVDIAPEAFVAIAAEIGLH